MTTLTLYLVRKKQDSLYESRFVLSSSRGKAKAWAAWELGCDFRDIRVTRTPCQYPSEYDIACDPTDQQLRRMGWKDWNDSPDCGLYLPAWGAQP